jgi:hypothetical protein
MSDDLMFKQLASQEHPPGLVEAPPVIGVGDSTFGHEAGVVPAPFFLPTLMLGEGLYIVVGCEVFTPRRAFEFFPGRTKTGLIPLPNSINNSLNSNSGSTTSGSTFVMILTVVRDYLEFMQRLSRGTKRLRKTESRICKFLSTWNTR